ncbi:MAG: MEDS domain-containing protein [Nitrososphaera sp.]|nr:MEDS domain-containing protein [Candidatus Nitrososphaera gargensis]
MPNLVKRSSGEHVMFLYDSLDARNKAALRYINDGLKNSQLVIYASVDADNESHISMISSKIRNYRKNIDQGNLLILKLRTFYERVLAGDLEAFKDFKELVEEIVRERVASGRTGEVLIVADCADELSRNKMFDESLFVERWWQNTYLEWLEGDLKITIICPHPGSVLENELFMSHKHDISSQHSMTLR